MTEAEITAALTGLFREILGEPLLELIPPIEITIFRDLTPRKKFISS